MKLMMPEHKIRSLTLSFQDDPEIVDVLLEITSISDNEFDRYFNNLMRDTLTISLPQPPAQSLPNAFKFKAECFVDVKKWIHAMGSGRIISITISMQTDTTDLEVLVHMHEEITLNDMRDYLHMVEECDILWNSVQRIQHYTGNCTSFSEAVINPNFYN
jgi:hypothetical protein